MAVQGKHMEITLLAGETLTGEAMRYKVVNIDGTICAAAGSSLVAGTLQFPQHANSTSGQHITVAYAGELKAYAAAAITRGVRLTAAVSGYVVTATSADIADGRNIIGKALEAANSGDIFRGLFNFANGG